MPVSIERFIHALGSTGILPPGEVKTLLDGVAPDKRAADANELARSLVQQAKITRFQAAALYQDKAEGLLLGNYLILDKLGAGGMGQVFRARHRRMDRVVALKVMLKKALGSPDAVARFQREVKAAARLTHPNIVTAYDADESGNLHFLVMEYVEGQDLSTLVKKNGPLSFGQALDFVLQAARGLEHAHGAGLVHRDIKPSNLLLDKKGTVKILDMGLARISDPLADPNAEGNDLTSEGSIMGTLDYMAPEQAMDSRQADGRADLYSLGCTWHYLLTGRPPYGGDTVLKRLTAHQQTPIPQLCTLRSDAPAGVQEVFERLMAKRPDERFANAHELTGALERLREVSAANRGGTVGVKPLLVTPMAMPPSPSSTSDIAKAKSVMLPGKDRKTAKSRSASNKGPVLIGALVVLIVAGAGGVYLFTKGVTPQAGADLAVVTNTADTSPATNRPSAEDAPKSALAAGASMPATSKPVEPTPDSKLPMAPQPPVAAVAGTPVEIATPSDKPPTEMPSAAPSAAPADKAKVPSEQQQSVATNPAPAPTPESSPMQVAAPPPDGKLPIPTVEAQREALKLLKEVYKDDYAQLKQPETKAVLAEKLLTESQQTMNDPAATYTILREARDLSVDAGNPALVERAIGMLSEAFAVDTWKELAAALEEMASKPRSAEAGRAIAEAALARLDEVQASEDFDSAKLLSDAALMAARKAKDPSVLKQAVEAGKTVAASRQQADALRKAQATLAEKPDDPAANLIAGRYLCFVQGQWEEGFPLLAKGADGPLKELATRSLMPPAEPAPLAELADAWFAAAEKAKGKDKSDLRAGAAYWYSQAAAGLSGLLKTKVDKRLAELGGPVARTGQASPLTAANGLLLAQTFDCGPQSHRVQLDPAFDLRKSWLLVLEFQAANMDGGSHQLLFWGDGRSSRDPLSLRIDNDKLEARICDATKDRDDVCVLTLKLPESVVGQWHQAALWYDASNGDLVLLIDGNIVGKTTSTIKPTADQPMPTFIGGANETGQRFTGNVRNVWLGNLERFSPVVLKTALKMSEVAQTPKRDTSASSSAATKPIAAKTAGATGKLPASLDIVLAPNVGMRFRLIAAGSFTMGSVGTGKGETPHKVNITRPFYMGLTEVTQLQWQSVMGSNPSTEQGDPQRPVECVSWDDAQGYLERLNQGLSGRKFRFRLPTEAEWEYACRADTATTFSFGDDQAQLPNFCWFKDNSANTTHPVGSLPPNPWGLCDMHGNVWEWCSDWHSPDYYPNSPADDPKGPDEGSRRILRGGSWANKWDACRSAERNFVTPDKRQTAYGFRVVCEPSGGAGSLPGRTFSAPSSKPNAQPDNGGSQGTTGRDSTPRTALKRTPGTLDLLSKINLQRDVFSGSDWKFEGRKLITPTSFRGGEAARLALPAIMPAEYVLHLTVTPLSGSFLFIGLPFQGSQCGVYVEKGYVGLGMLDGALPQNNPTTTKEPIWDGQKPVDITCEVRRNGITVKSGEKAVIDWQGEPSQVSIYPTWRIPNPMSLFIGVGNKAGTLEVSRLEIGPASAVKLLP
jgi:formylglycine-generating enzyme required for sulfatase activity/serine/threonine protein kinase